MTKVRTWEISTCKTHVERTTESLNSKRDRKWHVTIMYTLHAFVCVCEGMSKGVLQPVVVTCTENQKRVETKLTVQRTKGVKKKTMHLLFLTQNITPCSISNHCAYKSMFFYKLMGNTKFLVGTKFVVRSKPFSHRLSFSSIILSGLCPLF